MATAKEKRLAPLKTPTSLSEEATQTISVALTGLLADTFALYIKTKNFHWHVSGPHFRDYHLMLDEQSAEILAMTDPMAEQMEEIGYLRSVHEPDDLMPAARELALRLVAGRSPVASIAADNKPPPAFPAPKAAEDPVAAEAAKLLAPQPKP